MIYAHFKSDRPYQWLTSLSFFPQTLDFTTLLWQEKKQDFEQSRGFSLVVLLYCIHFSRGKASRYKVITILMSRYGIIGICGYFKDTTIGLFSGSLLAMVLRWCSTVVSGAVVFASYAPEGQNPWIYSMIYNASYMIPNAIINIAVLMIVYKALKKGIKSV